MRWFYVMRLSAVRTRLPCSFKPFSRYGDGAHVRDPDTFAAAPCPRDWQGYAMQRGDRRHIRAAAHMPQEMAARSRAKARVPCPRMPAGAATAWMTGAFAAGAGDGRPVWQCAEMPLAPSWFLYAPAAAPP